MTIFEKSQKGRRAFSQTQQMSDVSDIPFSYLLSELAPLPEMSELQVVRHFTRLSQKNFSIDTHFYPLGSCTMKYNPRAAHRLAMLPGFLGLHPYADFETSRGFLQCIF